MSGEFSPHDAGLIDRGNKVSDTKFPTFDIHQMHPESVMDVGRLPSGGDERSTR